ncbi:DUF4190 domain-containing protein [Dokdonella soli]|uniref:DUF4190 domain-containing protein n=2 Tax=Dokdonella soli TaxID=529810 RepID=A0ABN1IE70_9GAMM
MSVPSPRTSTLAVISLIFGILCWIGLPFLGAVVAIVCGHSARGEIRRAPPGTIEGDGMAITGLLLGWVHLLLFILVAAAFLLFFGGLAFIAAHVH